MAGFESGDTMPKMGHVTDLREQWLVRTDGALAHRLQDREISSHLCENRYRNQLIREDFPVALSEQRCIENEALVRDIARRRQADVDAEIAREMAEINLRRDRRIHSTNLIQQPSCSRAELMPQLPEPNRPAPSKIKVDISPEELGLSPLELEEMRLRLEQEEKDAKLARELSNQVEGQDALLADMRYAVEAQDSELARLLQEREYKKLQRAKEKAKQKALIKKQQRLAAQQQQIESESNHLQNPTTLLDAYSNPRDMLHENVMRNQNALRLSKSVESDLHYVEPFEKEHIESKASALQSKEMSRQYYNTPETQQSHDMIDHLSYPSTNSIAAMQHRQPPPPPTSGKKPRFPDPVSIRPASHYVLDQDSPSLSSMSQSYSENNNVYSTSFPPEPGSSPGNSLSIHSRDPSKRLSVVSDITPEDLAKKKTKQAELNKKRKGCKIQ